MALCAPPRARPEAARGLLSPELVALLTAASEPDPERARGPETPDLLGRLAEGLSRTVAAVIPEQQR